MSKEYTTIRISRELLIVLQRTGTKNQSYEDIIWNLLGKKRPIADEVQ